VVIFLSRENVPLDFGRHRNGIFDGIEAGVGESKDFVADSAT
jgi:hypothetical protein